MFGSAIPFLKWIPMEIRFCFFYTLVSYSGKNSYTKRSLVVRIVELILVIQIIKYAAIKNNKLALFLWTGQMYLFMINYPVTKVG